MFKILLVAIFMIFLIAVLGNVLLEQFPALIPLWEELKMHAVELYSMSIVKYGTVATLMLIIAIVILVGSSKKL